MRRLNNRWGHSTAAISMVFAFTMLIVGTAHNQAVAQGSAIGIVDTRAILTSLPDGRALLERYEDRDAELGPLVDEITKLRATLSHGVPTPQEQERYVLLQRTVDAVEARWAEVIDEAGAPLAARVDHAIAAVADRLGVLIVLDGRAAKQIGLVVYAHPRTVITAQVIAELAGPD